MRVTGRRSCILMGHFAEKGSLAMTEEINSERTATLAGGCFWCLEAVYDEMRGVEAVESGYTGGQVVDPSYYAVCSGKTGHAEAVRLTFDPAAVSYRELLEVFFTIHDPTQLNRQGNDIGTQYRSAIYFHSPEQEAAARAIIAELEEDKELRGKIVTEVVPAEAWYEAEPEHQEFFARNPNQPYCTFVVSPKVNKFRKYHAEKRKTAQAR